MKKYLLIVLVVLAGAFLYSALAEAADAYCDGPFLMQRADCVYTGPPDPANPYPGPRDYQAICNLANIGGISHVKPVICTGDPSEICRLPVLCDEDLGLEPWVCCTRTDTPRP